MSNNIYGISSPSRPLPPIQPISVTPLPSATVPPLPTLPAAPPISESDATCIQNDLEGRNLCFEVSVYRTPAKTGTVYWYSHPTRRPDGPWAVFSTSWKPVETDAVAGGSLGPGIDLVLRLLPKPDLPHAYCWLPATSLGPSQRVDCAGYSVIYTVLEKPSGGRGLRVDSIAVALGWIAKELKEVPRTARLGWFKELGLIKE